MANTSALSAEATADRGLTDDLGFPVLLRKPVSRVVSLVPSLTEAIAETAPGRLVGATDWCVRPSNLHVQRVRGTKNPNLPAIRALSPDLVVANQEENRLLDVQRLRASDVCVWVTKIDSIPEAFESLGRLFAGPFAIAQPPKWLTDARLEWSGAPSETRIRVALPIWKDPWIWVGSDTYSNDVLTRLGWHNAGADAGARYFKASPDEIAALGIDAVLLPDEPYSFAPTDLPDSLAHIKPCAVPGRALFWYGPAMVSARHTLLGALS